MDDWFFGLVGLICDFVLLGWIGLRLVLGLVCMTTFVWGGVLQILGYW